MDSIGQGIEAVWNEIKSIPGKIADGIRDLLVSLFIPDEEFFHQKFTEIQNTFMQKVGIDTSGLDELKNINTSSINNIEGFSGNINGKHVKFVDLSFLDSIMPKIHDIVRGFIYPLLIVYNMDQIYFLIRGEHIFGRGKGDD